MRRPKSARPARMAVRRGIWRGGANKEPAERYQFAAEMAADPHGAAASAATGKPGAVMGALCGPCRRAHQMPAGKGPASAKVAARHGCARIPFAFCRRRGSRRCFTNSATSGLPSSPGRNLKTLSCWAPRYVASCLYRRRHNPQPPTILLRRRHHRQRLRESNWRSRNRWTCPAFLRGLSITVKPMLERGRDAAVIRFRPPDFRPNEWPTLLPLMNDVEYVIFRNQSGTNEGVFAGWRSFRSCKGCHSTASP